MSSVIAIAKKKAKSNDNVGDVGDVGDLPASKKFQGDLPADVKAQILKTAFADRPTLESLQATACRLALVLCKEDKEDMKRCLQMFVPRSLGFIRLAASKRFPLYRRVETLHPISKKLIEKQMEFDVVQFLSSDKFLSSEHWKAEETPPIRATYKHGGSLAPAPGTSRCIYLVPRRVDHDSFGKQCVNVLTKLYPKLTFAYEIRRDARSARTREDYIHVLCDGIRCNIPISVRQ